MLPPLLNEKRNLSITELSNWQTSLLLCNPEELKRCLPHARPESDELTVVRAKPGVAQGCAKYYSVKILFQLRYCNTIIRRPSATWAILFALKMKS